VQHGVRPVQPAEHVGVVHRELVCCSATCAVRLVPDDRQQPRPRAGARHVRPPCGDHPRRLDGILSVLRVVGELASETDQGRPIALDLASRRGQHPSVIDLPSAITGTSSLSLHSALPRLSRCAVLVARSRANGWSDGGPVMPRNDVRSRSRGGHRYVLVDLVGCVVREQRWPSSGELAC